MSITTSSYVIIFWSLSGVSSDTKSTATLSVACPLTLHRNLKGLQVKICSSYREVSTILLEQEDVTSSNMSFIMVYILMKKNKSYQENISSSWFKKSAINRETSLP